MTPADSNNTVYGIMLSVSPPTQGFYVRTTHNTLLACDPATSNLSHRSAIDGTTIVIAPVTGSVFVMARRDGGGISLPFPHAGRHTGTVQPCIVETGHQDGVSVRVPDGHIMTSLPDGRIEGDRSDVGAWELYQLIPFDGLLPGSVTAPHWPATFAAAIADPSTDTGVLAAMVLALPADSLRDHAANLAARNDYASVFSALRMVLSGGQKRSEWDTRTHLSAGMAAYGWQIGDYTYGDPLVVDGQYGELRIGRYCSIAGRVSIVAANHALQTATTYPFAAMQRFWPCAPPDAADHVSKNVVIGHNVWIGTGATILPGARIGHGSIIGAQAVVANRIPAFSVAVGNPARVIKARFDPATIARFLSIKWWLWPDHEVDRAIPYLMDPDVGAFLAYAEARTGTTIPLLLRDEIDIALQD